MKKHADNPGTFARGRAAFANADGSWTEDIDAVGALEAALRRSGHAPVVSDSLVMLPELHLTMMPLVVGGIQPRPEGGVQSVTTVQLSHPTLLPSSIFEFQHAIGANTSAALERGFEDFAQLDLVPVLDALRATPAHSHSIVRSLPATSEFPPRTRRVVFGPVAVTGPATNRLGDEHDPACPCCMLMCSFGAFLIFLEGAATCGIRLYAYRTPAGAVDADCRVNGLPYPSGAEALRAYARSWSGSGLAIRKQYVIAHTTD